MINFPLRNTITDAWERHNDVNLICLKFEMHVNSAPEYFHFNSGIEYFAN